MKQTLSFLNFMLSILIFLSSGASAIAETAGNSSDRAPTSPAELAFAEEGQRLLKEMIDHGTSTIGLLDLRQLLSKSKSIVWRVRRHGTLTGSGENRQTAEHLIEERQVTMSQENLRIIPWRTRPLLSLHETWGALGVEDEAYQRTLGLFIYVYLKDELLDPRKFPPGFRDAIAAQFDTIEMRTQNPVYQLARGGTSVGSGGDGTALDFKAVLLLFGHPITQMFPELFNGSSLDLLMKVLTARIEINSDTGVASPTFERESGRIVIRIPGERWRKGYEQPDANPLSPTQWQMMIDTLRQLEAYK